MEELMPSLNHNSKSDFITAIFNKYRHSMKRVASRILKDPQSAEDTVSEAMIKIIKNVDIIDDIESKKCANFVYTITKNTALDLYRKKQKEAENCTTYCEKDTISYDIFESQYGFGDQMQSYLSRLSQIDVDIIALKYGDNFTYREIGLILEMSEDSVRQRAVRARKKLETMIQKGV